MNQRVDVTPLPKTVSEMMARREKNVMPSLNDDVERIHTALFQEPEYWKYLDALYDEDAITGAVIFDQHHAAMMIKEYAVKNNFPYVAGKKEGTISKSLNVVLRRFGIGRKQRARTVDGEDIGGSE